MGRREIFPLVDRIFDGELVAHLREWRGRGETYEDIAYRLRDEHELTVAVETVRRWCRENAIEKPTKAAS